jgi:ribonuclease HII
MQICGIDEAGRGPLAGPVVAAAVIMKDNNHLSDVRDSKKLSQTKRIELYDLIINNCEAYQIEIIDNKIIDEINILSATMLAMEKCLLKMHTDNVKILIDGNYFKLANNRQNNYEYETIIGGDDKIYQISCASILAKVTRDRLMVDYDKSFPEYNFQQHKGYGTKEHIENIRKYGLCELHRITFCRKFI